MKSIKQHISERLIINKHSNRSEITFDKLFDALSNMQRKSLHLADIWTPHELPTIPKDINITDTDTIKYAGEQINTLAASAIEKDSDPYILLSVCSKKYGNGFIYVINDNELYQIFSESQLQQILREALINKR